MVEESDDITRYRNNEMSDQERNAFEKKALGDPFLYDALEGAEEVSPQDFSSDVNALARKITPHRSLGWKMPLRIAAGVLLVITLGYLVYHNPLSEAEQLTLMKTDSTTVGNPDSVRNLLTLAEPEAAKETVISNEKIRDASKAKSTKQEQSISTLPASGAGLAQQPHTAPAIDSSVPVAADAEINEVLESKKTRADQATDQMVSESAPLGTERSKRSAAIQRTITGQVTEAEDDIPLPGVSVVDKESNIATQTDADGKYSIQIASQDPKLEYSFNGLENLVVNPGNRTVLDVRLKDDPAKLSEVVILRPETGLVNGSPILLAVPIGGLVEYSNYLETNRHVPQTAQSANVNGKATIAFNVSPSGTISGFAVVKSLGYGCDEEAIRLIKNGPGWNPSMKNGIPLSTTILIKLKFSSGK